MPTPRNHRLSRRYQALAGVPELLEVDLAIFSERYFGACLQCDFCGDDCCSHGVEVAADEQARILERAEAIEGYVGIPRERWFTGEWEDDPEAPGGKVTRTRVEEGACVFLERQGRGCKLHAFALGAGLDYHLVKPMISSLFPLTFEYGALRPSFEIEERSLVCMDRGASVYRGARNELLHYFGAELVAELDSLETRMTLPLVAS